MHSMNLARLTLFALPLLPAIALADAGASGRFHYEDTTIEVADALAYRDGMFLKLVFTDRPFNRVDFAADGRLDALDFMRHDGATLELRLEPEDGDFWGFTLRPGDGQLGTVSGTRSEFEQALKLSHLDDERVAGEFNDGDGSRLRFDLAIQGTEISRPGQALPADGGEPGQALRAMIAAVQDGDIERMIELSGSDQADELRQAQASGEAAMVLEMAKLFMPASDGLDIQGGSHEGDTAWVDFHGRDSTGGIKGTATMQRHNGQWRLDSINTTQLND